MKKKTAIIVGAGIATTAVAGYLVYKNQQKKKAAALTPQVNNQSAPVVISPGSPSIAPADQIADAAAQVKVIIPEVKQTVETTLPFFTPTPTPSNGSVSVPVQIVSTPTVPSFSTSKYSLATLKAIKWYGGPNHDVYVSDRIKNYDPATGAVSHIDSTWKGVLVSDSQINWERIDGMKESWKTKPVSIAGLLGY